MNGMHEITSITTLGLTADDNRILQTIMKIVSGIHKHLQLIETRDIAESDIVFVNETDVDSLDYISQRHAHLIPILLTQGEPTKSNSYISCRRPLVLKRILQAIETACSSRYESKVANSSGRQSSDSKHLLIVDDSMPVRKYMEMKMKLLSDGRCVLRFAENGRDAVEQIKVHQFDAVFLDVMMPDINGYKICKWIKSVHPHTKVIMLTGKKSTIDKVRGTMSGCDAYLTKPPSDERLMEIYQQLIVAPQWEQAIA